MTVREGRIEIEIPQTMRLEERDGVTVAVTDRPMPPLTQDFVRETLERVRDEPPRTTLAAERS